MPIMRNATGRLDQRIKFKEIQTTTTAAGGQTTVEVVKKECWADATPVRVRSDEKEYAERLISYASVVFLIRDPSGINDTDIIEWQGTDYNIRTIRNEGKRVMYTEIQAERGVAM